MPSRRTRAAAATPPPPAARAMEPAPLDLRPGGIRIQLEAGETILELAPIVGDVVVCRIRSGAEWPAWVVGVGSADRLDLVVLHAPAIGDRTCVTFERAVGRAGDVPANGYPTWRLREPNEGHSAVQP